jgi:hypothetical protein
MDRDPSEARWDTFARPLAQALIRGLARLLHDPFSAPGALGSHDLGGYSGAVWVAFDPSKSVAGVAG